MCDPTALERADRQAENTTAHMVRPLQYSKTQKAHRELKLKFSHASSTRVPSKTPSPAESFSKASCSRLTQRKRLWFIHTTAGKLGMVFTEFFTSSSVTSTTVQCSSSSGRGSSPLLVSQGCTYMGRDTVLSLPSRAESDDVGEERVKDTALPTGAVCLLVVLHFPLRVMHPSSLGNCCKVVLARQHPLKHSIVTSSATVPASSAASLKCFENGSYPEPFHLSLSCVHISSRSVCAPYLG